VCIGFLVALLAGFIAGNIAKRNETLHGLLSSIVGLCLGIGILLHMKHPDGLWLAGLVLVSAAAALGGHLAKQTTANQTANI
jgi:hypothetical protein